MIKAGTIKAPSAPLEISADDISHIADYLTRAGDNARVRLEEDVENLTSSARDYESRVDMYRRDIDDMERRKARTETELVSRRRDIARLPEAVKKTAEDARTDITRALALPFIKSIAVERDGRAVFIVATTRENSLFTTFSRKFSRNERWYRVKSFKVAMPAYKIRVGTAIRGSIANNDAGLGLTLANYEADTAHFLEWIGRYSHDVHPHWGTSSMHGDGDYKSVCLGEYESEVSRAFKASIADGLISFATYLQASGAQNGYVNRREWWGLWMGKKGYNALLVPSDKESKKLEEDGDEEDEMECNCGECELDECECGCHS